MIAMVVGLRHKGWRKMFLPFQMRRRMSLYDNDED